MMDDPSFLPLAVAPRLWRLYTIPRQPWSCSTSFLPALTPPFSYWHFLGSSPR